MTYFILRTVIEENTRTFSRLLMTTITTSVRRLTVIFAIIENFKYCSSTEGISCGCQVLNKPEECVGSERSGRNRLTRDHLQDVLER